MRDKLKKRIFYFSVLLSFNFNAQSSDWRTQYVKWHLGVNYNNVSVNDVATLGQLHFNKFSGTVSVDVAISPNDVFDSSAMYIQPFAEASFPVEMPYNVNLKYTTYAGGVLLKKHFNFGNFKSNFYVAAGVKIELINWRIKYSQERDLSYTSSQLDYVLNGGIGYVLINQLELFASYSQGLSESYFTTVITDDLKRMSSFNVGIRFGLSNNWWFSKR